MTTISSFMSTARVFATASPVLRSCAIWFMAHSFPAECFRMACGEAKVTDNTSEYATAERHSSAARTNAGDRSALLPELRVPSMSRLVPHSRDGAGDDLHGDAEHPAEQDQHGPGDMRLLAQHDHPDGGKRRQRRAECADGAEQFGGVDP